eukprot:750347-Hanusia_phi.AAC.1
MDFGGTEGAGRGSGNVGGGGGARGLGDLLGLGEDDGGRAGSGQSDGHNKDQSLEPMQVAKPSMLLKLGVGRTDFSNINDKQLATM